MQTADQRADQLRRDDGWLDPDVADLIRKLEAAERKAAERDDLLAQRNEWQERARLFCQERDQARRDAAKLPEVAEDRDAWRYRAETAERALDSRKPTPAPAAPVAPVKAPAPTPAPVAADPYAGLPPKMRAFLAAQGTKGLEID